MVLADNDLGGSAIQLDTAPVATQRRTGDWMDREETDND
jgi:hypothetical protein